MTRRSIFGSLLASLFAIACGGSSSESGLTSPPAGQTVVVLTAPAEADIQPGAMLQFGAQVTGTADTTVAWSVAEADGGTVDATGLYTAPAIEGTFHVRAVSSTSGNGNGTSVVRVKRNAPAQQVVVAVNPGAVNVLFGGSALFAAAVTGTANLSVTWTVQEGSNCGTVSSTGTYTAPNAGATCHVVATSAADTTKSGSATVTVTAPPPHVVSVTPSTASVLTGGTTTFSATVTGTTAGESVAVTWSVPAGSGTIGASTGVYVAPATAGTYVVTATSVATPSGSSTATVTVSAPAPVVAISISPASATIDACKAVVFAATVINAGSNTAVTWTVTEAGGGTVTNGIYTAPSTAGTYHVVARSVADTTKTVQGTIIVGPEKVESVAVNPGSATVQANGTLAFSALVTTTCGTFAAQ
jgi:uncharacterized cupin superfamily protein